MASKARLASAPKTNKGDNKGDNNKGDNNKGDRHIYFKKICVLTLFSNQFIYLPPNTAPWHFKLCHVFYILNVPVPLFLSPYFPACPLILNVPVPLFSLFLWDDIRTFLR